MDLNLELTLLDWTLISINVVCLIIAIRSVLHLYKLSPAWRYIWILFILNFFTAPIPRIYGTISGAICPDNTMEYLFVRVLPVISGAFSATAMYSLNKIFSKYLKTNGIKKHDGETS